MVLHVLWPVLAQAGDPATIVLIVLLVMAIVVTLVVFVLVTRFLNLWVQAFLSGAPVSMLEIIGMRMRKTDPRTIILAYIRAKSAGLSSVTTGKLEKHHLSGGHIEPVINAMILAKASGVELTFESVAAIDFECGDVVGRVRANLPKQSRPAPIAVAPL